MRCNSDCFATNIPYFCGKTDLRTILKEASICPKMSGRSKYYYLKECRHCGLAPQSPIIGTNVQFSKVLITIPKQ